MNVWGSGGAQKPISKWWMKSSLNCLIYRRPAKGILEYGVRK
jgi:hypothetical protein